MSRESEIKRVLWGILFLNLLVALAKILLGYFTQTASVFADGFHSLSDGASNIVGLIGITIAARPRDESHHYGHRKFETIAALMISMFLAIVCFELVKQAVDRLLHPSSPVVNTVSFAIMLTTLVINIGVTLYEKKRGQELKSEILVADSYHTRSDVLTTISVIIALIAIRLGYPIMDIIATCIVAGFIAYAAFQIFLVSAKILGDASIPIIQDVELVLKSFPEVKDFHNIRTLGHPSEIRVDIHIGVDAALSTEECHSLTHRIEKRLQEKNPSIQHVMIHVEPQETHC